MRQICLPIPTLLWLVAGSLAPSLQAQTSADDPTDRPTAHGTVVDEAPLINGLLDEEVWGLASPIANFVQHEPFEGRPATERTEVRILYDARAVYIGAWMFDSDPSAIVVGETRRDASLQDTDALLFVFDTYLDHQNGFVFATTPAGIEHDGQVINEGRGGEDIRGAARQQAGTGGGFNLNWDGSWEVATSVDEQGWYAEFRIPFSTLRYGGGGPQTWGMNISRQVRRRNEQAFWAPIGRQYNFYRVSQAGTLDGITAPTRRTMTLTPYGLSSAHRDFVSSTETDFDAEVGGEAKLGLSSSLTLDLTVNTDFAQVEVDEQQINLDRFRLFFPEKRPFFLENAGTFAVGSPQAAELFFSRRIGIGSEGTPVPIIAGGRLTGKAGGFTLGLLNIQTDRVDGAGVPNNNYAVGRVTRELPNRSRLGAIVVSRLNTDDTDDYNLAYAVDGRMGIGEAVNFDGYAAWTETPELTGREHAWNIGGGYDTRDWSVRLSVREVGEDFNPEVGFLTRAEYRSFNARVQYNIRPPGLTWLRELRPHISFRSFYDFDGFSESRNVHVDSHIEFSNGAFFSPAFNFEHEGVKEPFEIADGVVVSPGVYDNVITGWQFNSNLSAPVSIAGELNVGGFFSGTRKGISGNVNARMGTTLAAGLRFGFDDVDLAEGSFQSVLLGLRVAYSFTPRIFLQSLVQYNNQSDDLSGNVRFGWLNTAGTGLFLVYNEVQQTGALSGTQDRAFVVKFTRQFNLLR
jgi:hypothetical protein